MDDTFQTRILRFLRAHPKGVSFQEIADNTEIPEHKLSLALGIMVHAGQVFRDESKSPALYQLTAVMIYPGAA